jgi:Zn-dependent protease
VGLAVFNLIPIPPLDGSHILSFFANDKINRWMHENREYLTKGFFAFMLISTWVPQLGMPINKATTFVSTLIWYAVSWIPKVFG